MAATDLPPHLAKRAFSTAEANGAGVSNGRLRRMLTSGHIMRLTRGWYCSASLSLQHMRLEDLRARVAAQADDVVVGHVTAARLHELRTPFESQQSDDRLWLLRDPDAAPMRARRGVVVLPAQFHNGQVQKLHGVRVTTIARTAMDLARNCPLERALVPIDHALALGVPRATLVDLAVYMKGWPGTRVFKAALEIANPLAESGLESTARAMVVQDGLPLPQLQVQLRGKSGKQYRVDMYWPAWRVILEVDGAVKYQGDALYRERLRQDDLEDADYGFVRWTYDSMMLGDRVALQRLRRKIAQQRARLRKSALRGGSAA